MNRRTVVVGLCTTATFTPARAQPVEASVVKMPQDIVYNGLPGAPQHVTLFGDSSQPELYVDRIRFLPGMRVMPHWHPDAVRTVLVMSGTFYCLLFKPSALRIRPRARLARRRTAPDQTKGGGALGASDDSLETEKVMLHFP